MASSRINPAHTRRRPNEGTLILLGLLCGWPGGMAAQQVFRHKTKKQPFRAVFWVSVITNVALLMLFAPAVHFMARSCSAGSTSRDSARSALTGSAVASGFLGI